VCLTLVAVAAPAGAATWTQPNITSLGGTLAKGSGAWLELPWTVVWKVENLAIGSGPRSVQHLPDGTLLVVSRGDARVYELSASGVPTGWEYVGLSPTYAARVGAETLVVEPYGPTVLAVDHTTPPVEQWRVDFPVGTVPVHATVLPATNTLGGGELLVCDRAGRVVAVRKDGTVTWEYSTTTDGWPVHAEYIPTNGNVLITFDVNRTRLEDDGVIEGNLVREVRPDMTTAWQYGTNAQMGSGSNQLAGPTWAERLADGSTMITDSGNNRIVRVDASKAIVWQYSAASLLGLTDIGVSAPGAATIASDGSVVIADTNNNRLIALGRAPSGMVTSAQTDCGLPGVRKKFSSITVKVEAPAGTAYTVSYSIDGGSWRTLSGTSLPANTYGKLIRYRVTLTATRRDLTPRLLGVSVAYAAAPTTPSGSGGTGTGTGTSRRWTGYGSGAGTGIGSGVEGVKQGGAGYTSGESVTVAGGLEGPLSTQQGWTMASVGAMTLGNAPGSTGGPAPSLGGLLVLGALYSAGAVSVPFGQLIARLFGRA
jgi:hypothetical protein